MLNITSSSYSVYETGKVLIQTSFIYEIVKKYNLSIDGIFKKQRLVAFFKKIITLWLKSL
ncbi:MAG: hypothetical protein L6V91_08440 [Bacilli bacterium]|nr:MAG: hypothetical protein L6V91_08440 [Bacilli bacterium]